MFILENNKLAHSYLVFCLSIKTKLTKNFVTLHKISIINYVIVGICYHPGL